MCDMEEENMWYVHGGGGHVVSIYNCIAIHVRLTVHVYVVLVLRNILFSNRAKNTFWHLTL